MGRSVDEFPSDIRSVCTMRYAIVKIVEAAVLVDIHMLESKYGLAVETYSEVFEELGRRGWCLGMLARVSGGSSA
ncbi:MAG: hypothetical protein QXI55_06950 [Thermofilum sp.]